MIYKNYQNIETKEIVSASLSEEGDLYYVIKDRDYDFIQKEEFERDYKEIKSN